ncbi:hypothetical protein CPAR01_14455 [Colletotrichum paranaense]|uniref:Secreted protein n=1 Tax=Colletotrichum paranaense TaxID=1914294 RepID=A0ABQ9S280_9PEZI|nr:uncharacterized protein CPAR01_14455 [Colletotrichum paranaense]KAK1522912.1 hypothetical protein CPAR01_14455 [Colletotrichum paranaense]
MATFSLGLFLTAASSFRLRLLTEDHQGAYNFRVNSLPISTWSIIEIGVGVSRPARLTSDSSSESSFLDGVMNRPACTRGLFPAGLLQAPSRRLTRQSYRCVSMRPLPQ